MHSIRSAPAASAPPARSPRPGGARRTARRRASAAAPQSQRGTPSGSASSRRAHVFQLIPYAADETRRWAIEPCTSISSRVPARACSRSMFCVITASSSPARLELGERLVRPVGLLVVERLEALAVEAPERSRVAAEHVDVRDLHRVDVLPQPRPGRAEVGDPRRHRDPRAGQRDDRVGAARISSASAGAAASVAVTPHASLAPERGLRFSRNAAIPSRASSEPNTLANACFSRLDAGVEIAGRRHPLDLLDRAAAPGRRACAPRPARCRAARDRARRGWRARARSASSAEIGSPVRFISSARASPTRRGSRCVPPNPGMIPRLISGWPKLADCAAIRTSQAIASSQPPPSAIALTAAIVAIDERSISRSSAVHPVEQVRPPRRPSS